MDPRLPVTQLAWGPHSVALAHECLHLAGSSRLAAMSACRIIAYFPFHHVRSVPYGLPFPYRIFELLRQARRPSEPYTVRVRCPHALHQHTSPQSQSPIPHTTNLSSSFRLLATLGTLLSKSITTTHPTLFPTSIPHPSESYKNTRLRDLALQGIAHPIYSNPDSPTFNGRMSAAILAIVWKQSSTPPNGLTTALVQCKTLIWIPLKILQPS